MDDPFALSNQDNISRNKISGSITNATTSTKPDVYPGPCPVPSIFYAGFCVSHWHVIAV